QELPGPAAEMKVGSKLGLARRTTAATRLLTGSSANGLPGSTRRSRRPSATGIWAAPRPRCASITRACCPWEPITRQEGAMRLDHRLSTVAGVCVLLAGFAVPGGAAEPEPGRQPEPVIKVIPSGEQTNHVRFRRTLVGPGVNQPRPYRGYTGFVG